MAKKAPKSIDNNFEELKKKMLEKKLIAENKSADSPLTTQSNIDPDIDNDNTNNNLQEPSNKVINDNNNDAVKDNDIIENNDTYVDIDTDANVSVYSDTYNNIDNVTDVYNNVDVNANNVVNNNVNISNDVNAVTNVNKTVSKVTPKNNNENAAGSLFVIKSKKEEEKVERFTYYLKPSTDSKIEEKSAKANMGKSEFLEKLLEAILDVIEIQ